MTDSKINLNFEIKANQILFLWELLFVHKGEPVAKVKLKVDLAAPQRKILENDDLIEVYKEGRGLTVVITERGWVWCEQNLSINFKSRSQQVIYILQAQLQTLEEYCQKRSQNLYDYFHPQGEDGEALIEEGKSTQEDSPSLDMGSSSLIDDSKSQILEDIKDTYFALTHQAENERVHLNVIKERLKKYQEEELNTALICAHRDSSTGLTLYPLDMPNQISAKDKEAAVYIADFPFHIVYIEK